MLLVCGSTSFHISQGLCMTFFPLSTDFAIVLFFLKKIVNHTFQHKEWYICRTIYCQANSPAQQPQVCRQRPLQKSNKEFCLFLLTNSNSNEAVQLPWPPMVFFCRVESQKRTSKNSLPPQTQIYILTRIFGKIKAKHLDFKIAFADSKASHGK